MQMHDVHLRQEWRCIPEVSVSEIRKNRMPDRNVRHFLIQETAGAACPHAEQKMCCQGCSLRGI